VCVHAQSLEEHLEALQPVIRRADKLLSECEQLTPADVTADVPADTVAGSGDAGTAAGSAATSAVERRRYDTLMHRYHDVIANVSKLVAMTTESIHRRDSLSVSC